MAHIILERDNSHCSNSKENKSNRSKNHTPPKIDYKGITVKEYFRLCDEIEESYGMEEIQEESLPSSQQSKHSNTRTPCFGGYEKNNIGERKKKMKTEIE